VAAARVVTDLLAPVVIGRDALAPAAAQRAMVDAVRNAGRVGLVGMAISAVDIALWDLTAQLLDQPLTSLWGATADPVAVYGSGGFTTYSQQTLGEQLESWVGAGIPCEAQDRRVPRRPRGSRSRAHAIRA
jgi:L-alanine-DL-glutamate epimerase-like enolase superfamily enzyme